jgi:alcohol dehydrogenase class IV
MQFRFFMPTKVYFGNGCIQDNKAEFLQWGKKALVVTGRNSARLSGALADVTGILKETAIEFEVFDKIEENPTLEAVEAAGIVARRFQPDMIIAIGGGSPLDASKAIAVLAVNDMPARNLYNGGFAALPLPILAVPLTAGTGSEVTPYSILTDVENQTKCSFSDPGIFPKVAFLDARYTQTLSRSVTVNSAVDALSHAIEGYLSRRSTPVTDCMALDAIRCFGAVKQALIDGSFNLADREALLQISLIAGIVLAQTATTMVHALGYSLTYFRDIPHGRANGLLLAEYLRFNELVIPEKVHAVLDALGLASIDEFSAFLSKLLTGDEVFSPAEIEKFAVLASKAPNTAFTARQPNLAELQQLLQASLPVTPRKV